MTAIPSIPEGCIYFEYGPVPWPPDQVQVVHTLYSDEALVEILGFPDGHLALTVDHNDQHQEHHFQRVRFPNNAIVKIAFSWGPAGASAAAGGVLLDAYDSSPDIVLDLNIKGEVTYKMGQLVVGSEVMAKVAPDEWLFLETLGDLSRRLSSASRYDMIRISALLRQLLFEANPLAIALSRRLRHKLSFEVSIKSKHEFPSSSDPRTSWRTLFPDNQGDVFAVDLDRFRALRTIVHDGVPCTVYDVIDLVAHILGGVHLGESRGEGTHALASLEKDVLMLGVPMVFHSLHDIGRVALNSLLPLGQAIVDKHATSAASEGRA